MSEHKLASAEDFRNDVNEDDCYEPTREVQLPKSQKRVLLRRPKPVAYTLLGAPLPGIKPALPTGPDGEIQNTPIAESDPEAKHRNLAEVSNWALTLWTKVFVHPKIAIKPGPGEIHPDWICEEDQKFVWAWIRGEVKDSGESLSNFPANS